MHKGAETNKARAEQRAEIVIEMRGKGLTYEEISDSLKVSQDVVRQIVSRHNKRVGKRPPVRKYRIKDGDVNA